MLTNMRSCELQCVHKRLHNPDSSEHSPGKLTRSHPSSSASATQGLGPFRSTETSWTSPNKMLLSRWNMVTKAEVEVQDQVASWVRAAFVFSLQMKTWSIYLQLLILLVFSGSLSVISTVCWPLSLVKPLLLKESPGWSANLWSFLYCKGLEGTKKGNDSEDTVSESY